MYRPKPLLGATLLRILLADEWEVESKEGRMVYLVKQGMLEGISFNVGSHIPLKAEQVERIRAKARISPERFLDLLGGGEGDQREETVN